MARAAEETKFLMHRVELKAIRFICLRAEEGVPNAPCGVERTNCVGVSLSISKVPNAPCGVERLKFFTIRDGHVVFLMHRVELKGRVDERFVLLSLKFLMHRVELKGILTQSSHI